MSSQPAIETICSTLNEGEERPRSQVTAIVEALGEVRAMALLAETQRIELSGGMLVPDGTRRRTAGGVFFVLARRALSPHDRERIFSDGRQHAPAPKPAAPAPPPARPAPPPNNSSNSNNSNNPRRFENRAYHSSSFSGGSGYAHGSSNSHGRTHTYTAHGSTRQTTVEFSSRLGSHAAQPAAEPTPPPPAPAPPNPPTLTAQGQKLVPLRRRIVSLPALQPEPKPAEPAADVVADAPSGKRGRGRRGQNSAADSAANDTTPAKPEAADLIRARTAIRALGSEDRRLLLLEMVDELGSDRDPTKPKVGLRDLVLSKLASGLALGHEHWGKLLGSSNGNEHRTESALSQLAPHQLERIDRFVTLLVDSLDPDESAATSEANGAPASSRSNTALSGVGAELEMRTRQFATRLHALVRSATLQSVQQAFSGAAARRSSAPPPSRRAARKPARQPKRPSGRRKPKKRGR